MTQANISQVNGLPIEISKIDVELFPHTLDSGLGTEVSPYTNADSTAGIQTHVNTLAAGRGGAIKLAASRFNITTQILITSPCIKIEGVEAGYNIDPNAIYQGVSASALICTTSCISIAGTTYPGRTGAVNLSRIYMFCSTARQSIGSSSGTIGVEIQSYTDQTELSNINIGGFDYGIKGVNSGGGGFIDFTYFHQTNIQGTRVGIWYDNIGPTSGQHYRCCCIAEQDEHNVYVTLASTNISFIFDACAFYRGSSAMAVTNPANVYFGGDRSRFIGSEFCQAGHNLVLGTNITADGMILAGNYNLVTGCEFLDNSTSGSVGLRVTGHDNIINGCVFNNNAVDLLLSGNNNTVTSCNLSTITVSSNGNMISSCTFNYAPVHITITGSNNTIYVSGNVTISDSGTNNSIIGDYMLLQPGQLQAITKGMQMLPSLTSSNGATLVGLDIKTTMLGGIGTVYLVSSGSSYTNGTYTNTPLITSKGSSALATIIISGGSVNSVTVTAAGSGYVLGSSITVNPVNVGGTGTGFSGLIQTLSATTLKVSGLRVDGIPYGSGGGLGSILGNIAIGDSALQSNTIGGNGLPNIAIGANTLSLNTIGVGNIAIGQDASANSTTASNNTSIGSSSTLALTTGSQNSMLGSGAGKALTVASYTTAVGQNAIFRTTTPDYNTGVGSNSGQNNILGSGNVFIGAYSGQEINSPQNTIVGFNGSGGTGSTGKNTIIGANTYFGGTAFNNNIILADGDGNSRVIIDSSGTVQLLATSNQGTYPTAPTTSVFTVPQVISKGSLPWTKITTSQKSAISSPLEAVVTYDTDIHKVSVYDGTTWQNIAFSSSLSIHGNSTTTGTATTAVTVTIGSTMSGTSYYVDISPQDLLTAVNWYVSSKTTTQFTITFVTALTGSINFDWSVTP